MPALIRRLDDWIPSFLEFTDSRKSPAIFRKWAGISAISSVLERKVYIRTDTGPLYPSMYNILVGPPTAGKSVALKSAEAFVRKVDGIVIAPTNISGAALMDSLNEAKRVIVDLNSPLLEYRALSIFSSELSSLLPVYDSDIMGRLTDLYDCEHVKEAKRGGTIRIDIPKPYVMILGCTTPEHLNNFLPEGAWGQGFMSRVILVFADEPQRKSLFSNTEERGPSKLQTDLEHDLQAIGGLAGRVAVSPEAAKALQHFEDTGGAPAPSHYKLVNYLGRRTVHLIKLCMIAAVSGHNELTVELEDFQTALAWLLEAEAQMGNIFKAMGTGGTDAQAINDTYEYLYQAYVRNRMQPVPEHLLIHFLQLRVPPHSVLRILELMCRSNMAERSYDSGGRAIYKPIGRQEHQL